MRTDGEQESRSALERRFEMRLLAEKQGFVSVADLSDLLGVSVVTVRSDLDRLAGEGTVQRVRGGAVPTGERSGERSFEEGLAAPGRLADLTDGIAAVEELAQPFTPAAVAPVTGIPADAIRRMARELAAAGSAAVYGRIGTTTQAFGTLASWLVDVLNDVAEMAHTHTDRDILRLYEIWLKTGSPRAFAILQRLGVAAVAQGARQEH